MSTQEHKDGEELNSPMAPARLHEEVERIAIPVFDWVSDPIVSITEGLILLGHVKRPSLGRHWHHGVS